MTPRRIRRRADGAEARRVLTTLSAGKKSPSSPEAETEALVSLKNRGPHWWRSMSRLMALSRYSSWAERNSRPLRCESRNDSSSVTTRAGTAWVLPGSPTYPTPCGPLLGMSTPLVPWVVSRCRRSATSRSSWALMNESSSARGLVVEGRFSVVMSDKFCDSYLVRSASPTSVRKRSEDSRTRRYASPMMGSGRLAQPPTALPASATSSKRETEVLVGVGFSKSRPHILCVSRFAHSGDDAPPPSRVIIHPVWSFF